MTLTIDEQSEGVSDINVGDVFHANFTVEILTAEESEDGDLGKVEAIVSAFNVPYRMGFLTKHKIMPGAFAQSLGSNANIPIFWMHNWDWSEQPPIGTGVASTVVNPKPGLKVAADFFLDIEAARATFRAIKSKALREWSIGYRIQDFKVEEDDDGFRVIVVQRAELLEASSVLRGANPETETLKVARQMPPELQEVLDRVAYFMQSTTELFDLTDKRLSGIEAAHGILVESLEDSGFKVGAPSSSGESVEPAVGGDSDVEPETAASPASPAPDSPDMTTVDGQFGLKPWHFDGEKLVVDGRQGIPFVASEVEDAGPDRIDRAYERALARIASKWEAFVEQAGAGLDGDDVNSSSREDIESLERVLRCLNRSKYTFDAVERTVTARVLAESARKM